MITLIRLRRGRDHSPEYSRRKLDSTMSEIQAQRISASSTAASSPRWTRAEIRGTDLDPGTISELPCASSEHEAPLEHPHIVTVFTRVGVLAGGRPPRVPTTPGIRWGN